MHWFIGTWRNEPNLPVWRRGPQIRWGKYGEITEKWHWGAFLSSWVWALANRIYWPLFIIAVSFIPYLGQVASLFLCTYLGLNGYKLAWAKRSEKDFKKFISSQKKWVVLGVFIFLTCAVVQCVALYYILNF